MSRRRRSALAVTMPGVEGVQATRDVLAACPHIGVLVLSMVSDDDSVFAAMQAGVRGYLLKGARKAEIVRAVRAVASGEAIFGADIATRLIGYFPAGAPDSSQLSPPDDAALFPSLNPREVQILRLVADQLNNADICGRLGLPKNSA